MPAYYFNNSSKIASEGARYIENFLYSHEDTSIVQSVENNKKFQEIEVDWIWTRGKSKMPLYVEGKVDTMFSTGNYFFETISNLQKGTPGCIAYSEADYLIYYFYEKELHLISMPQLQEWLEENQYRFPSRSATTPHYNGTPYTTVGKLVPRKLLAQELNVKTFKFDQELNKSSVLF